MAKILSKRYGQELTFNDFGFCFKYGLGRRVGVQFTVQNAGEDEIAVECVRMAVLIDAANLMPGHSFKQNVGEVRSFDEVWFRAQLANLTRSANTNSVFVTFIFEKGDVETAARNLIWAVDLVDRR